MTLADLLGFVARALHTGAMSVWLGSGLLYLLTRPGPERRANLNTDTGIDYSRTMKIVAGRSFGISVASGVYLLFDRLANPKIGLVYVTLLAVKLIAVAGIAWSISIRRPARAGHTSAEGAIRARWGDPGWQTLALGVAALLLGVALTLIYEAEMRGS